MPQWKSWLVIGGYVLVIYGALLAAWIGALLLGLSSLEMPLMTGPMMPVTTDGGRRTPEQALKIGSESWA